MRNEVMDMDEVTIKLPDWKMNFFQVFGVNPKTNRKKSKIVFVFLRETRFFLSFACLFQRVSYAYLSLIYLQLISNLSPVYFQFNFIISPILVIGEELERNWRGIGDVLEIWCRWIGDRMCEKIRIMLWTNKTNWARTANPIRLLYFVQSGNLLRFYVYQ